MANRRQPSIKNEWIKCVVRTPMSTGCKELLLVMASEMHDNGYVSVKQVELAEWCGVQPRMVRYRLDEAVKLGLVWKHPYSGRKYRKGEYHARIAGLQVAIPVPPISATGGSPPATCDPAPIATYEQLQPDIPEQVDGTGGNLDCHPMRVRARPLLESEQQVVRRTATGLVLRLLPAEFEYTGRTEVPA